MEKKRSAKPGRRPARKRQAPPQQQLSSELELRAELAKREEDLRISRKHRIEAGERPDSVENNRAYARAVAWERHCARLEQAARGALIRFNLGGQS